jgi:hypothetical protein
MQIQPGTGLYLKHQLRLLEKLPNRSQQSQLHIEELDYDLRNPQSQQ